MAMRTSVIRREKRSDDKLTHPDRAHRAPDFLNDPAVLMAHRRRIGRWTDTAVGPQVGAADARGRDPDNRIRPLNDPRRVPFLETHIARSVENSSSHD